MQIVLEFPMQLAEYLRQSQQVRQNDRQSAIAYFDESFQNISSDQNDDLNLIVQIMLDFAAELIVTKKSELLEKAKTLIDQVADLLNQNPAIDQERIAYSFYIQALLDIESGQYLHGLETLQSASMAYGDVSIGKALTDDLFGEYYLLIGDLQSALISFERSLSVRLELEDEYEIAKSYISLGQLYLATGDINQAASLFQSSLDIAFVNSYNFLQWQALKGLAKVAIAECQWQLAITLIKDAIIFLKEPINTIELGYLYCDFAEALLGDRQIRDSLLCIRIEVLPRFRDDQHFKGIAIAKHLRGRIYTERLQAGLCSLDEDEIETTEDSFLDALICFEQLNMMLNYAKCLYDLASLYRLCNSSHLQYQYQGKALRSLELAISVLDKLELSKSRLGIQIESMINQVMRGNL
jgi:tetratricopeptide (TPR) repeat protein